MRTTRYFEEQVLRKRPYIERDWCREVIAAPIRREAQGDGRIRFWGRCCGRASGNRVCYGW